MSCFFLYLRCRLDWKTMSRLSTDAYIFFPLNAVPLCTPISPNARVGVDVDMGATIIFFYSHAHPPLTHMHTHRTPTPHPHAHSPHTYTHRSSTPRPHAHHSSTISTIFRDTFHLNVPIRLRIHLSLEVPVIWIYPSFYQFIYSYRYLSSEYTHSSTISSNHRDTCHLNVPIFLPIHLPFWIFVMWMYPFFYDFIYS
jgi:hypothetical protein